MKTTVSVLLACFISEASFAEESEIEHYSPDGSIPYYSVEESLQRFRLPEGFSLEPVLSEPSVMSPVLCVFDGNGRMFVAEMRTYMQDADATGEQERISRVSLHEDTDGDGAMDKHTVFADNLLLPRMVLPLDDRVLINETNTLDIYAYRDTDGDGVADEKKLFFEGGDRGGNMEHQPSGLIWAMDNWLYTTYNSFRLRYRPNAKAIKEAIPSNGGQWGLTQDNYGKPWFTNAGAELGPVNIQQPIVYGKFNVSDQTSASFREVYPLLGLPDMQAGERQMRTDTKTLNHFTATGGQSIFRGDRLPADLRGNLFLPEPVGRLIRSATVEEKEGITFLSNAYPKSEFLRSTDPNFRPVNTANGPDGCLYIVDMHHGIIQHAEWTSPGTYVRKAIEDYGLDRNHGKGRIYRLVHKDFQPGPRPRMLDENSDQLVRHLEHPNGWWRDTAQKLLILNGDHSVIGDLENLALEGKNELGRIHAIWTLEGLGALSPELIRTVLKDSAMSVRRTAIRAGESLIKQGKVELVANLQSMVDDAEPAVVTQALLSAKYLDLPGHRELTTKTMRANSSRAVREFGTQMIEGGNKPPRQFTSEQASRFERGQQIYESLCFACHGADGKGTLLPGVDSRLAPSLVGSQIMTHNPELPVKVLLHGLTGPVEGKTYSGEMIAMGSNGDAWIADVLSYVKNSFGNQLGFISEKEVHEVREKDENRANPWTAEELISSAPELVGNQSSWGIIANSDYNRKQLKSAIDGDLLTKFTTPENMKPGNWFRIKLKKVAQVSGIILDAGAASDDYPRGYLIEISLDGKQWKKKADGNGSQAKIEVTFEAEKARYIRITQTSGNIPHSWSIADIRIIAGNDLSRGISTQRP